MTDLNPSQAEDKVQELLELKAEFGELVERARQIMRGTGMIGTRAETYWINHIEGALDNRGSMVTLQDTIDELDDLASADWEACPECGCKPGDGYKKGCTECHAAYIDAMETADDQMGDSTP